MDWNQLVGANVCLHGAILPHHVSWSHRGHHLYSNPGSTERQWVTRGNMHEHNQNMILPTSGIKTDLSNTNTRIVRLGSQEITSSPSGSSYTAGLVLMGSQSLQMLYCSKSILQEDLLSRELMLSSLLFLVEQIKSQQHPLPTPGRGKTGASNTSTLIIFSTEACSSLAALRSLWS